MSVGLGRSKRHYIRCRVCGRFFLPGTENPAERDRYCTRQYCQRMKKRHRALLDRTDPLLSTGKAS